MKKIENGDIVRIHYTGKLEDGTEFDSSVNREPLEFTLGAKQVISGLESGILGMGVGDSDTISIPCEEAYGIHSKENVQKVERTQIPPELKLEKGQKLQMSTKTNQMIVVTVVDFDDNEVTLDENHELAGKTLIFDVEIIDIIKNKIYGVDKKSNLQKD